MKTENKTYLVKFTREVMTELEFEIEATDKKEAVILANREFEEVDWDYHNENDTQWTLKKIKELK